VTTEPLSPPEVGPSLDEAALRAAFTPVHRPRRPSAITVSTTFAWRSLLRIRHVPEQLLDVTFVPVMVLLSFTYLFGGAIAGSTEEYLQFLLPGVLVQTVLFTTVYTGATLNTDLSHGLYDRFRSMPVGRPAPMIGALLADLLRYLVASVVVVVLGLVLGFTPDGGAAGVVAAVALLLVFASGVAWLFTFLGMVLRAPNAVMNAGMVVLFPLTLASNVFVPPETMPDWLETLVDHNPVTRMVTATRSLMAGSATFEEVAWVLGATAAFALVFVPLVLRRFRALG
jgi:ABC-2 type transport system permease protein